MAKSYVICEISVSDPEAYETYKALSGPAVAEHGGTYVVRGGEAELLEGVGTPNRVVVLEFPSMDAARGWYDSPAYRAARSARADAATARFVLVAGVD
jgi:uncharacterized protein (DUF1330 family)